MKCATHIDQEAVGVCSGCGVGVCTQCFQRVGGIIYCLSCLDLGRHMFRTPLKEWTKSSTPILPSKIPALIRHIFALGIVAMALLVAGFYLSCFYPLFPSYYSGFTNNVKLLGLFITAVSISICGFAFLGFWKTFNSKFMLGTALFSLIAGWLLFFSDLLIYSELVLTASSTSWAPLPGPLYPLYVIFTITGFMLLGLTFLFWSLVLLLSRRYSSSPILAVVASIFFLCTTHVILLSLPSLMVNGLYPYLLLSFFIGGTPLIITLLIEPAAILTAITFYKFRKEFP